MNKKIKKWYKTINKKMSPHKALRNCTRRMARALSRSLFYKSEFTGKWFTPLSVYLSEKQKDNFIKADIITGEETWIKTSNRMK